MATGVNIYFYLHYACVIRMWEEQRDNIDANLSFAQWIRDHADMDDIRNSELGLDIVMLARKPSQKCLRYEIIKAFGNHFRVQNNETDGLKTYDSGVATVADAPLLDARDVSSINYVGVLKDILKLNYGPVQSPIILLRCEWIKKVDRQNNPTTYIWDDSGFLMVNFKHKLPKLEDPFIFPSQATQVFFSEDRRKPGWKVVLRKDPRARREVLEESTDVFMCTEAAGLTAPTVLPPPPTQPSLEDAVELTNADHQLAVAAY